MAETDPKILAALQAIGEMDDPSEDFLEGLGKPTGPYAQAMEQFHGKWEADLDSSSVSESVAAGLKAIGEGAPPPGSNFDSIRRLQNGEPTDPIVLAGLKAINDGEGGFTPSPVQMALREDEITPGVFQANERKPTGIFSGVIDVLSRFQYAETAMLDEAMQADFGVKAIGGIMARGIQEFFVPHDRLSFVDILQKLSPEKTEAHPVATLIAGTALDMALDPTTWLSFGVGAAGKAVRVAAKTGETLFLTGKGAKKLTKLTQVSQKYISDELLTDVSRIEWAEEKIATMAMKDPSLVFKKGFQIHMNIPLQGKHVATILKPESAKAIADMTGLTAIRNAVGMYTKKSTMIQSITGTFRQVGKLPPKYLKLANNFLSTAEDANDTIVMSVAKMAKGLNKEGAVKIGKAAHKISDDMMALSVDQPITSKLLKEVKEEAFTEFKLGEKEVNVYSEMRRGLQEMRTAERNVGLMIKEVAEYFPRYYDNVVRSADDTGEFYKRKRFTDKLKAAKSRVFESVQDAQEAGLNPEWNAVKSFQMRAQASRKAVAKKEFDVGLEKLMRTEKFNKKTAALIKRDAREIGDSMHPDFDKAWMNALVNANDVIVNAVFRPAATILKPGFATFQALSNTVQMMWAGGFRAGAGSSLGVAKHTIDAIGTGFGGKYWESMRKTLFNIDPNAPRVDSALILKNLENPAVLRNSRITTDIGTSYSGEEVAMMVKQLRIAQGRAILGVPGGIIEKSAMSELRRQNAVAWVADKTGVGEGFVDFASGAAAYWNWPRMIEDMARTNFFTTALRQGHSPHESMRLVNKALYDYTGGLSKFERMWVKRVMPFYSFTRFTLPLAADVAMTKPGRLANTSRGLKAFFGAWNKMRGGEQLNDTERHTIPGWILEQPSTFAKFGMDQRAHFNAFTNWTPLDAVNFLEPGDEKRSGMQRTVQKSILSMITPALKLPLEHIMNTNFFTGRTITDIYRTKDRLGETGTIWKAADAVIPDALKPLMGWEKGLDIRTNKENIYINPYLTHYMTGVAPVLNNVVRILDADLTIKEKAMWTFGNISTYKIDMAEQYKRTVRARRAAIQEKRQQIRYLRNKGLEGSAEEYQFELEELLNTIGQDFAQETEEPRGMELP